MPLKADFHLHTREGDGFITYDARGLVDRAAALGYGVLSITNHDTLTFTRDLARYAEDRGILLVPGVEATIEGRHVLVYNLDVAPRHLRTFADLRRLRAREWLVVAPHPFFPASYALGDRLLEHLDLFDAIELSHFYTRRLDFNGRAVRLAREARLPLIGTSDAHLVRQFGATYSLVEAAPTLASVLDAVRQGTVRITTRPLTLSECAAIILTITAGAWRERARAGLRSTINWKETFDAR
jgi:predicted metal-dependent phosphoesterase TrpH